MTGGSGLLGGRVSESLLNTGFQVRLGTREPLGSLFYPFGVEVVAMEWENEDQLLNVCHDVDVIVNAMGMNAADCAADPISAIKVNGEYTAKLVHAAFETGVKRFVHLSTAHVYGSPLVGAISESTHPSNLHPYATSHRCGEDAVLWADHKGDLEGVILRLSNAYGRPINPSVSCWMLLVNDLCRQAVEKKRLVLQSDGVQYRDFIPIHKVCDLIVHICNIDNIAKIKANSEAPPIFNVGSGCSITVSEMAKLIQIRTEKTLGYEVDLVYPQSQSKNFGQELRYTSERLSLTSSHCDSDSFSEIDELLLFCREQFSNE